MPEKANMTLESAGFFRTPRPQAALEDKRHDAATAALAARAPARMPIAASKPEVAANGALVLRKVRVPAQRGAPAPPGPRRVPRVEPYRSATTVSVQKRAPAPAPVPAAAPSPRCSGPEPAHASGAECFALDQSGFFTGRGAPPPGTFEQEQTAGPRPPQRAGTGVPAAHAFDLSGRPPRDDGSALGAGRGLRDGAAGVAHACDADRADSAHCGADCADSAHFGADCADSVHCGEDCADAAHFGEDCADAAHSAEDDVDFAEDGADEFDSAEDGTTDCAGVAAGGGRGGGADRGAGMRQEHKPLQLQQSKRNGDFKGSAYPAGAYLVTPPVQSVGVEGASCAGPTFDVPLAAAAAVRALTDPLWMRPQRSASAPKSKPIVYPLFSEGASLCSPADTKAPASLATSALKSAPVTSAPATSALKSAPALPQYARLPRAYGLACFPGTSPPGWHETLAGRLETRENLRRFNGTLLPYQPAAVEHVVRALRESPVHGGLLEAACGAGKTTMALFVASVLAVPVMVLVHTGKLLEQWVLRAKQYLPNARLGTLQGKQRPGPDCDICIGMLQTVMNLDCTLPVQRYGLLVVDECHHICASSFSRAVTKFDAPYRLGLTATVQRGDGTVHAIEWIIGPRLYSIECTSVRVGVLTVAYDDPEFEHVTRKWDKTAMDWVATLTRLTSDAWRTRRIAELLYELAVKEGRRVVAISSRKRLLEDLHALLPGSGLIAGKIRTGKDEPILLASQGLVAEGIDDPRLDTLVLLTPVSVTKEDQRLLTQAVGRVQERGGVPKARPSLVVDFYDKYQMFSGMFRARRKWYADHGFTFRRPRTVGRPVIRPPALLELSLGSSSGASASAQTSASSSADTSASCSAETVAIAQTSVSFSASFSASSGASSGSGRSTCTGSHGGSGTCAPVAGARGARATFAAPGYAPAEATASPDAALPGDADTGSTPPSASSTLSHPLNVLRPLPAFVADAAALRALLENVVYAPFPPLPGYVPPAPPKDRTSRPSRKRRAGVPLAPGAPAAASVTQVAHAAARAKKRASKHLRGANRACTPPADSDARAPPPTPQGNVPAATLPAGGGRGGRGPALPAPVPAAGSAPT